MAIVGHSSVEYSLVRSVEVGVLKIYRWYGVGVFLFEKYSSILYLNHSYINLKLREHNFESPSRLVIVHGRAQLLTQSPPQILSWQVEVDNNSSAHTSVISDILDKPVSWHRLTLQPDHS